MAMDEPESTITTIRTSRYYAAISMFLRKEGIEKRIKHGISNEMCKQ